MSFLKNNITSVLFFIFILSVIGWIYFIVTPSIEMSNESLKKIDSLNKTILLIEGEQHKIDSQLVKYNKEIDGIDENISNIKSEKTIIREIYHEKINSVNTFNTNQLDSFFSSRYNY